MTQDELKKQVAQAALKHVVEDAVVGVGSDSTVSTRPARQDVS
jgi:ribose 5-phosphate isomerase